MEIHSVVYIKRRIMILNHCALHGILSNCLLMPALAEKSFDKKNLYIFQMLHSHRKASWPAKATVVKCGRC